jgi:hypothetical protein
MSDYGDPHDPMYEYRFWGLIAGVAVLLIILSLGLVLGIGHRPTRVASIDAATPQQTTAPAIPPTTPGLAPPQLQAPNRP